MGNQKLTADLNTNTKISTITSITSTYRGFHSIDQEMEREIAMQWFTDSKTILYSHRNFLHKQK